MIKDAGDDPDVTNKAEIVVTVQAGHRSAVSEKCILLDDILLCGGQGIGTVTKPGLSVQVGQPAINPVPRQMIVAAVREVTKKKKHITLTNTEFKLLMLFASNPGVVFSRDRLLDEVRDRELEPFDRSIDAHISNLRNKIEDSPKKPCYIITVWGAGYKFQGT